MWSANICRKLRKERLVTLKAKNTRSRFICRPQARDRSICRSFAFNQSPETSPACRRKFRSLYQLLPDSWEFRASSNRISGMQPAISIAVRFPKDRILLIHRNRDRFVNYLAIDLDRQGNANTMEKCVPTCEDGKVCIASRKAGECGSANANETLNEGTKTKVWRMRRDESSRREYQILKCI